MPYLVAVILGCLAVELFLRLPFRRATFEALGVMHKARRVVASRRLSDEQKQRFLMACSCASLRSTLFLALLMVVLAAPILGCYYLLDIVFGLGIDETLGAFPLAVMTVASVLYAFLRARLV